MEENITDGGHGRALDQLDGESEKPATLMQDGPNQFFSTVFSLAACSLTSIHSMPCTMCAEMDASVAEENVSCKLSICQ